MNYILSKQGLMLRNFKVGAGFKLAPAWVIIYSE